MAPDVFLDSSALIALTLRKDQNHTPAVEEKRRLHASGGRLVSSTDVLDETVTFVRRRAGHRDAVALGDELMSGAFARVFSIDDSVRAAAWALFRRYRDVPLSLTDCTSLVIMRRFGMTEVFSFDSDFERVGMVRRPI